MERQRHLNEKDIEKASFCADFFYYGSGLLKWYVAVPAYYVYLSRCPDDCAILGANGRAGHFAVIEMVIKKVEHGFGMGCDLRYIHHGCGLLVLCAHSLPFLSICSSC